MKLEELTTYLDSYLRVADVPDYPPALNGLQLENAGSVTRVAAAVDASEASIHAAVEARCDLLLVHHGLFWDGNRPVTGRRYRRLKAALDAGLAIYSAHMPLDLHDEVGNNVVLSREVGLDVQGRFGDYEGVPLGVWGTLSIGREALAARLEELLGGRVQLLAGGAEEIERIGIITGGAGSMIDVARAAGLDAFITGEGAHHTYFDAIEGGINVYYGGHYATETWGVRALAAHLSDRFGLPWAFLDLPTGL